MAGVAALRGDGVDESLVDAADHVAVPSGGGQHRIGEVETEFVDMVTAAHGLDSSHWMFKLRGRVRHPLQKTTTPAKPPKNPSVASHMAWLRVPLTLARSPSASAVCESALMVILRWLWLLSSRIVRTRARSVDRPTVRALGVLLRRSRSVRGGPGTERGSQTARAGR